MSPEFAGRFLITELPGKPSVSLNFPHFIFHFFLSLKIFFLCYWEEKFFGDSSLLLEMVQSTFIDLLKQKPCSEPVHTWGTAGLRRVPKIKPQVLLGLSSRNEGSRGWRFPDSASSSSGRRSLSPSCDERQAGNPS